MELLIFVLILFTIVFVIYLCGHITETLEEIKIVRANMSNFRDEFNNRIDTISIRHYNVINMRLDDISNRLDELAGEDGESECDVETHPAAIDDMAQNNEEAERDCVDECEPEKCPVEDCKHKKAFLWSLLS